MEWGRAKTILIISFLCLNLLLAYQLWINNSNQAGTEFETNEIAEETQQLLRNKGIRLEKVIPKDTPTLREITVQFDEQFNPENMILLDAPVKNNILLNKAELDDVLAEEIEHIDEYRLDPNLSGNEVYVMDQLYNGLPMFEISLKLYNRDNEIYAYSQSFVEIEAGDAEEDQRILSAYRAVSFLAENNYLNAGAVIRDVSLGYHGQNYNSETQVLAPKWRIVLNNGDIYYVNGINGEVERHQRE